MATLARVTNGLVAGRVSAVLATRSSLVVSTVVSPPCPRHWLVRDRRADPAIASARKLYIGMLKIVNTLTHIAEAGHEAAVEDVQAAPPHVNRRPR